MTLPSSGLITAAMINTELNRAASAPFSLNDAAVRALAQKLTGAISFADLHGKSNEVVVTLASRSDYPTIQNLFDAAVWSSATPKRVVIPAGVEIGAPAISNHAIATGAGWGGSLTIENRGTISGRGGAANSGVGGDAIYVNGMGASGQQVIINNHGTSRAGGGGGGRGGNGGAGNYQSPYTFREPTSGNMGSHPTYGWVHGWYGGGSTEVLWQGRIVLDYGPVEFSSYTTGGWTYRRGTHTGYPNQWSYGIYREQTRYNTIGTTGGAGGNGGRGQGYDAANAGGSTGAAGSGAGAGTGGTGATGGGYGATGGTGNTGAAGNVSSGLAGAAGGLSGRYISYAANCSAIINNYGTLQGRAPA